MVGYIYAELNDAGIVKALSQLSAEIIRYDMIKVGVFDPILLGKKYNVETGLFEILPAEPVIPKYGFENLKTDILDIKGDLSIIKAK